MANFFDLSWYAFLYHFYYYFLLVDPFFCGGHLYDLSSFFSFVNGPLPNNEGIVEYQVTNSNSAKLTDTFSLGYLKPYETKFIEFGKYIPNLSGFLKNNSGSITLSHNFEGFYPRFLTGTMQSSFPSVSFTHSYYDCTSCSGETDFWDRNNDMHHDHAVYIPLFTRNSEYTNLIVYPNSKFI